MEQNVTLKTLGTHGAFLQSLLDSKPGEEWPTAEEIAQREDTLSDKEIMVIAAALDVMASTIAHNSSGQAVWASVSYGLLSFKLKNMLDAGAGTITVIPF